MIDVICCRCNENIPIVDVDALGHRDVNLNVCCNAPICNKCVGIRYTCPFCNSATTSWSHSKQWIQDSVRCNWFDFTSRLTDYQWFTMRNPLFMELLKKNPDWFPKRKLIWNQLCNDNEMKQHYDMLIRRMVKIHFFARFEVCALDPRMMFLNPMNPKIVDFSVKFVRTNIDLAPKQHNALFVISRKNIRSYLFGLRSMLVSRMTSNQSKVWWRMILMRLFH